MHIKELPCRGSFAMDRENHKDPAARRATGSGGMLKGRQSCIGAYSRKAKKIEFSAVLAYYFNGSVKINKCCARKLLCSIGFTKDHG